MTTDVGVLDRARPSRERAAAAARLAGAPDGPDAVTARMREAAARSRAAARPKADPTVNLSQVVAPPPTADPAPARLVPVVAPAPAAGPSLAVAGSTALAVVPQSEPEHGPEESPRPRHLTVVPEGLTAGQRRRRARALLIAGIGGSAAIGLALVYFHVVLAQRQFAIDRLDHQVQQAQAQYQGQRLEVAQLGSPQHIISMAEGQLGMHQPANVTYFTPSTGGTVPGGTSSLAPSASAPAGDANWPQIKSQLAGTP